MQTVGFIGLGEMGAHMSARLKTKGTEVVVYDVRAEAVSEACRWGARHASSVREVADRAETVFLSLPSPQVVSDVVTGSGDLVSGTALRCIVDLSTTGPTAARDIERIVRTKNINWIDAPVSGGAVGAEAGTLSVMVSGKKPAFEGIQDLLQKLGKTYFIDETPGAGQVVKLGNNLLAASAMIVTAEVMALGAKSGVDAARMLEVIGASSGRNSAVQDKFPKAILTGGYNYGFTTGLFHKDISLCLQEAAACGIPMTLGAVTREIFSAAKNLYGEHSDQTNVVRMIEEWSSVQVRG